MLRGFLLAITPLVAAHYSPHRLALINVSAATIKRDYAVAIAAAPGIINNNDWVTVNFTNPSPSTNDWIGAYSPSPENLTATAPIEWFAATASDGYMKNGIGSLRYQLVNMRADVQFVFFRGGMAAPVALAFSNKVAFRNYNEPRAPRLALLGNSAKAMQLSWTSQVSTGNPNVVYTDVYGNSKTVAAATTTYSVKVRQQSHELNGLSLSPS